MKERDGVFYRIEEHGVVIDSCEDIEGELVIPDEVSGKAVTEAAPYAFSRKRITELTLPRYLKSAGKYLLYRCFSLKKLCFSDAWQDIGAGAFTGCRPEEIEIDFYDGEKSCLKFLVDEIRFELRVTMHYHQPDGTVRTAKVIFPEHYEEAVENTPARIVETHYHGSGGYYRQCFYNKELNYGEYDSLLPWAIAEEEEEVVVDIAACRLRFPYKLTEEAKKRYEEYLKEHMNCAGERYVLREDTDMLRFFGQAGYWTEEALDEAIERASEEKSPVVLSLLMEEKHRCFPKKKKVFEL